MIIRRYNEKDIPSIISLEEEAFSHSLGYDFLHAYLSNMLAYIYVLEEDNNIIGYISTTFDGDVIEIMNFCIKKEKRRMGYATKLINHVFNELKGLGAKSSFLEVRNSNNSAINLYTKLGFKKINTRYQYYSDGEDALVLQLIF